MARTPHYGFELTHGGHVVTKRALNEGLTAIDAQLKRLEDGQTTPIPDDVQVTSYIHGCNLEVVAEVGSPPQVTVTGGELYVPSAERLIRIENTMVAALPEASAMYHFFVTATGTVIVSDEVLPRDPYVATARQDAAGNRYIGSYYYDVAQPHNIVTLDTEILYDGSRYDSVFQTVTRDNPMYFSLENIAPVAITHKCNVTIETRNGADYEQLRVSGTANLGKLVIRDFPAGIHHIGKIVFDGTSVSAGSLMLSIDSRGTGSIDCAVHLESYSFER